METERVLYRTREVCLGCEEYRETMRRDVVDVVSLGSKASKVKYPSLTQVTTACGLARVERMEIDTKGKFVRIPVPDGCPRRELHKAVNFRLTIEDVPIDSGDRA
jgi:hypothetical protein